MKKIASVLCVLLVCLLLMPSCTKVPQDGGGTGETGIDTPFTPKLDTNASVTLNVASFFGNFEAMDEVLLHFNEYYPNVTIQRDQVGTTSSPDFLKLNPHYDIFMTSNEKGYIAEDCLDLIAAGVDVRDIADNVVEGNKYEGVLYTLPMSLNLKGMVVNKTLLAKERLEIPQTWSEFLTVLEQLKSKGYTPIQGSDSAVSTLVYNMGMSMLASDSDLYDAVCKGDATKSEKLKVVFERIQTLLSKEYISTEVNATYPKDNYNGAILKFFEGDVPFWVCDTEKVSGMKKRESKSEAFQANSFEYEFMFVPLGENGAYEYIEPWYGFAVNKNSTNKDYAVEFLRFMAYRNELNTLASVKGVPSIAKVSTDTRYANIGKTRQELAVVSNGTIMPYCGTLFAESAEGLISGTYTTTDALQNFLEKCKQ